jgi:hypothetical protein
MLFNESGQGLIFLKGQRTGETQSDSVDCCRLLVNCQLLGFLLLLCSIPTTTFLLLTSQPSLSTLDTSLSFRSSSSLYELHTTHYRHHVSRIHLLGHCRAQHQEGEQNHKRVARRAKRGGHTQRKRGTRAFLTCSTTCLATFGQRKTPY